MQSKTTKNCAQCVHQDAGDEYPQRRCSCAARFEGDPLKMEAWCMPGPHSCEHFEASDLHRVALALEVLVSNNPDEGGIFVHQPNCTWAIDR